MAALLWSGRQQKTNRNVLIVCDPLNYDEVISTIKQSADITKIDLAFRQKLALEAFEHTAAYDAAISDELHARWVGRPENSADKEIQTQRLPETLLSSADISHSLRYGEIVIKQRLCTSTLKQKEIIQHWLLLL